MTPEFWQAVKEFGIPAVYLALTIFAFSKLWKHHLKVTETFIADKVQIQSRADEDKKELEKCTKEDKEKLENEVRELYKELVNITLSKAFSFNKEKNLYIFIKTYNLTDNKYEMPWQFRDTGFSITSGIRMTF